MREIFQTPVIGWLLFDSTFHMSTFWIMSGYLCELQLSELRGKGPVLKDYMLFLMNRIIRLYPLYFISCMILYVVGQVSMDDPQCSTSLLVRSLLFIAPLKQGTACTGASWSVPVDVHGYVVLVILSMILPSGGRFRRNVMLVLYLACFIAMALYMLSLDQEGLKVKNEFGPYGLQHHPVERRKMVDFAKTNPWQYFKHVDFDDERWKSIQRSASRGMRLYHSSLFGHGSSILLGSALFTELKERRWTPYMAMPKVLFALLFILVTRGHYAFCAVATFAILDVLLCLEESSPAVSLLSHKLWKTIARYSYGIYQSHFFVIGERFKGHARQRAALLASGKDACAVYSVSFAFRESVVCFLISWVIGIGLQHVVEQPFTRYRSHLKKRAKGKQS